MISCKNNICPMIKSFKVLLVITELLEHKPIFSAGYNCIIHVHAVSEECNVIKLNNLLDKKTKKSIKKDPRFARNGDIIECTIESENSICMETFENNQRLGRFTLRDEGKTIAIGKII